MNHYLLTLLFEGTNYHGWQVQPNAVTVQETVQDAAERIFGTRMNITGCSRTDSGVHADMFCCTLRTEKAMEPSKLRLAMNAVLPPDIAVKAVHCVPETFHPRYDALGKEYRYVILNTPYKNPFYVHRALHYPWKLDLDFLNAQAKDFIGTHDFTAFCAAKTAVADKVRTVTKAEFKQVGDTVEFRVAADGFLYNMVRIMVGTLLDMQRGAIAAGAIPTILESKDREHAGVTAPPEGLYLHRVFYPKNIIEGEGENGRL